MAMKDAVNMANERKFQKVYVEMDSREIHLILTNKCNSIDWRIKPLIVDILNLLKIIPKSKVLLIKK